MFRRHVSSIVILCLLPAAAAAQQATPTQTARADSVLRAVAHRAEPGVVAIVVRGGDVVYRGAIGLASLEQQVPLTHGTVLDIGSVSKQFTAFAIALLEAQGQLSLDDDIRTHLPEVPDLGQRVTIRHLLQHTSGLREIYNTMMLGGWQGGDVMRQEQALRIVIAQPALQFAPGSEHLYNNTGYMLLADIVARVSGVPFHEWMQDNVFGPLGMDNTFIMHELGQVIPGSADSYAPVDDGDGFVRVFDNSTIQGAGGIYTTAEDLARWVRQWSQPVVGSAAVLKRMQERAILTSGDTLAYALGISVATERGLRRLQHGGSSAGYRTSFMVMPELAGGIIVQSNNAGMNVGRVSGGLLDVFFADRLQPRVAGTAIEEEEEEDADSAMWHPSPAQLAEYAGRYYSTELEAAYRLTVENDTLVLRQPRLQSIQLEAREQDLFRGPGVGDLRFERDDAGRVTGFIIDNGRTRGVRFAVRDDDTSGGRAERRDYSAPMGAPYTAEEVVVSTPAGHTLAGTLTLPKGADRDRPVPAIITITGSGPQDRDESLGFLPGYRPFRQYADSLGRRGIAVLRMDDRGTGSSTGDHDAATSTDFAADIRAGLAYLRTRPEIDSDRLGLVGHSEGGLIAPLVAAQEPDLAAVVLMAGPSWTGRRILEFQLGNLTRADTSLIAARLDSALATIPARIDSLKAADPWMGFFIDHDVLAVARQIEAPVLVLNGATDLQVTAAQAEELAAAIREGGNDDVTAHVFPDLNHLFLYDPVGMPMGYSRLTRSAVEPKVVGMLVDWLVERLRQN